MEGKAREMQVVQSIVDHLDSHNGVPPAPTPAPAPVTALSILHGRIDRLESEIATMQASLAVIERQQSAAPLAAEVARLRAACREALAVVRREDVEGAYLNRLAEDILAAALD